MHLQRILSFSLVTLLLFIRVGTASLYAADEPIKGKPALPGESCQTKPLKNWTCQEKWVWKQACEGNEANFNEAQEVIIKQLKQICTKREIADFNKAKGFGGKLDPRKPEGWPRNRVLRPSFLRTILLHEPYHSALTPIGGAWFKDPLYLSDVTLTYPLGLYSSRFDSNVILSRLETSKLITLEGSKFTGELDMDSLQVHSDLFMNNKAEFAAVDLTSAKIQGQLNMTMSKFNGYLDMNLLQVGSGLVMGCLMNFSNFLENVQCGFADNVNLAGAKIQGYLLIGESKFEGRLDMPSLEVDEGLLVEEVTIKFPVNLSFAKIGKGLSLIGRSDSALPSLDLTDASVQGGFFLDTKWQKDSTLILRNTEVGTLRDQPEVWPDNLELDGFTYGGLGSSAENGMAARDISWFKGWLEKQKRYSPQPYEQLASVLRKAGYEDKADDVLYAGRDRERSEARWQNWLWLTAQKYTIGYGYHIHYAAYWAMVLIVIGMLMLGIFEQGPAKRKPACFRNYLFYGLDIFFYSLSMLIPLIELDKRYEHLVLTDKVRYYFYIHRLMGYVLAFFLIVALSGLAEPHGRVTIHWG